MVAMILLVPFATNIHTASASPIFIMEKLQRFLAIGT